MSSWPPWAGSTGTTPAACTATSTTYPQQSSKPSSTLRNGPTTHWSKSNSPSLHQNQCNSRTRWIRARWRWYTVDLLDLVEPGAQRSERVSLHRAVHGLNRARELQINEMCPYGCLFAPYQNEFDKYEGGLDLSQLSTVDPRWPNRQGRSLWFRLPPPQQVEQVPEDDQLAQLEDIEYYQPDAFRDFTEALDHRQAWQSPVGRYIRWLFCGPSRRLSRSSWNLRWRSLT